VLTSLYHKEFGGDSEDKDKRRNNQRRYDRVGIKRQTKKMPGGMLSNFYRHYRGSTFFPLNMAKTILADFDMFF